MINPLSLLFTNRTGTRLLRVEESIRGASWTVCAPEILGPGTTGGPYGSLGAESGYSGNLVYRPEGTDHSLGLYFEVTADGAITLVPSSSSPFEVREIPIQDGDLWIVRLVFLKAGEHES